MPVEYLLDRASTIKSVKAVNSDNTMDNEKYLDISDVSDTSNISDSIIRHWQENWGSDLKLANILFFAMESNIKRTAVLVSPLLQAICRAVSP
jgi:hypothetical protein